MEPQWRPLHDSTGHRAWQRILRPVAAQLDTCAKELAATVVARYQAELPAVVPDPPAVAEQLASTEACLRQIAQGIATGADPRRLEMPPPAAAIARSGVQRNIALNDLTRSVRLGQEEIWRWLFDRIAANSTTDEQKAALELGTNWLFGYCDLLLVNAENLFEIEREAWLRGAAAARAAAVDDIITGREGDPQRASKRLRYDINRHHVGVSIWRDGASDEPDALATLSAALSQLAHAVSAQSSMIHPAGSMATAAWLSRPQAFTAREWDLGLPADVRVAVGEPGWGIGGFRRTHADASHAHRFASSLGDRAAVVTYYRDVAVAALASADSEHAVAFVKRILGPLAADDEATYRIATTLGVYLEENRSPARAAQRLTVHPNTVGYRVHRAEELLGRQLDTNTVDLSVALALLPALRGLTHGKD